MAATRGKMFWRGPPDPVDGLANSTAARRQPRCFSASAHGSIIWSCHIMRGTTEFQCVLYASTSWFDPLNFVEGSRYRRRSIAVWRLGSWRSVSYRLSLTRSGKGSSRTRVRHPVRPGQPVAIEAEGPPYRGNHQVARGSTNPLRSASRLKHRWTEPVCGRSTVDGVQSTPVGKRLERRARASDCLICPEDRTRGVAGFRSACSEWWCLRRHTHTRSRCSEARRRVAWEQNYRGPAAGNCSGVLATTPPASRSATDVDRYPGAARGPQG